MKKVSKISTDIRQKQDQELTKKLYRATIDHAKRLDDARSCARTIFDLFTPTLQIQRRKFVEYCEKLIFYAPILYGKRGEELLWRKGFYDTVTSVKKLKKTQYTSDEIANIETHINSGIGFYHHFISKLQTEYNFDLKSVVDFSIIVTSIDTNSIDAKVIDWGKSSIHQSLIYLGDLSRYKLEFDPNCEPIIANRYYLQAISFKSELGMPHNQMGTLSMSQNKFLDAVYHYLRCLSCKFPFEGTTNNLHSLFDKSSKFIEQLPEENSITDVSSDRTELIKRFIARFLLLIDIWYFNKKVNKVYNLCHQTYKDFEECLKSPERCDSPLDAPQKDELDNEMIFKIIVILLLTISKLEKSNSSHNSTAIAFMLGIYSQLLQSFTNHIQESVLDYPITEIEIKSEFGNGIVADLLKKSRKKRIGAKLRRKRAFVRDDCEESDESADEIDAASQSEDSESDSEPSSAESSDEEASRKKDEQENRKNIEETIVISEKVQKMDVNDMLEIIAENGALQSIKIVNDWLMHDLATLKSCCGNTRSLLRQITNLLNLINIHLKSPKLTGIEADISDLIRNERKIPLTEDVMLKGCEIFEKTQRNFDWNLVEKMGLSGREECIARIVKFLSFGRFLTGMDETGISFDEKDNVFVCRSDESDAKSDQNGELEDDGETGGPVIAINEKLDEKDSPEADHKGQLLKMKHMGQLWLASEVSALEHQVKGNGKASLSPYLVLDADALIKYTFMVKHLVQSRKFIVLIPLAVVSALDDLKREQSEARDAIRWLEAQFQRGNRFFRSQRPQERAPIPFIKYPKKKDKEMTIYIQIIECCYFLAEQQKGASNLVTLLIGNQNVVANGENKELSYVGLAKSAGVAIELIGQFYGKWKKSAKGVKR